MKAHELAPPPGAKRPRKRVGRGDGSGHGTYSGRGMKGQKSRTGGQRRPGFEGGQLPMIKRLPEKRGFFNRFRTEYSVVNLFSLNRFPPNTQVTPELLCQAGLVKSLKKPVKVLGEGQLQHPLRVKAHAFSAAARSGIEAAGGQVEEIS